jgi:hypothetical protein
MTSSADLLSALTDMAALIPGRRNPFGALGYGVGRRMASGRITGERAMLVFVPRKLREPAEPLPTRVPGTEIPIDIVALGRSLEPDSGARLPEDPAPLAPASPLGLRSREWRCVAGFGLPHDAPEYVVTVRHPFVDLEPGAAVFSHRRRIGSLASDSEFKGHDLALVRLAEGRDFGVQVPSGDSLSGSGVGQFMHLGMSLRFYSPVRGTLVRPRVIAIRVTAFLLAWGGGRPVAQEQMIVTEGATSVGDSGAPLFDDAGTIVGLASFRTDQFSFFEGVGHERLETLMRGVT